MPQHISAGERFVLEAKSEFSFLKGYGFEYIDGRPTILRYRRGKTFIHIYQGRRSKEIGLEFGLIDQKNPSYSMSELISLSSEEEWGRYRNFAATDPESIARGLFSLSEYLQRFGEVFLTSRDDDAFFAMMAVRQRDGGKRFALRVLYDNVRERAHTAFRNKDYASVVRILDQVEEALTPSELKKLAYARERTRTRKGS